MSLVRKKAPVFQATAVVDGEVAQGFSLESYFGKKYVVLFFYPKDFSAVCPTELWAFQEALPQFEARDVAVVACSCDTEETHAAWLSTPKERGGIEGVTYPIVADPARTIASNYGVLPGDWEYDEEGLLTFDGVPVALRGTFLIDREGIVRHENVNDLPLARSIKDTLRMVDVLQRLEQHGEVCPANWEKGEAAPVA